MLEWRTLCPPVASIVAGSVLTGQSHGTSVNCDHWRNRSRTASPLLDVCRRREALPGRRDEPGPSAMSRPHEYSLVAVALLTADCAAASSRLRPVAGLGLLPLGHKG